MKEVTVTILFQILDTTPPVIQNCPSQLSEEIGFGATSGVVAWPTVFASDNSGQVQVSSNSRNNGDIFPLGTTAVTIEFSDPSGNTALCSFTVTVTAQADNIPPVVICPPDVTETVELGTSSRQVIFDTPNVSDNSGSFSLVQASHQSGNSFTTGTTTVTYTYADGSGNTASCSFVINIIAVDRVPPQVTCPPDEVYNVEVPLSGRTVNFGTATATDLSTVSLVSVTPQTGTFFSTGSTTVTYTYRDASNNEASCTFSVIVNPVDTTNPQIVCPERFTESSTVGTGGTVVAWISATATDNSGFVTVTSDRVSPMFLNFGETIITYTARDSSGNIAICSFTIVVIEVDNMPPVVICPLDVTETVELGTSSRQVFFDTPSVTDDSGIFSLVQASHQPGNSFTTGSTTVTYTYTDGSQNSASCSFQVNIIAVDRVPPQVTCPPDEVYNVEVPLSGRTVNFGTATATDLSTVSLVSVTPQTGTFFSTGSTTVTYTYRDASNNQASCTFSVIVNPVDTTNPQIVCPEGFTESSTVGTGGTVVTWISATATDNSGFVTVTSDRVSPMFFNFGETIISYTARDPSGNIAICSFTIVVIEVDNMPPVVICPLDVTETVELGTSSRQVFFDTPSVTDDSGIFSLVQASHQPGNSFTTGSTTVTYTYTDGSQNSASCSFQVNIIAVDRVPPQVTCPPDEVYNVEVPLSGRTVNFGTATATDLSTVSLVSVTPQTGSFFSTGSTTVTYTYRDASNNEASCTFLVIVNPEFGPMALGATGTALIVIYRALTRPARQVNQQAWYPCYGRCMKCLDINTDIVTTVTSDRVSPMFLNFGETIITYTARDPSGNIAICSFTIIVIEVDNIPPVVNCPADVTQTVELGTSSRQVFFDVPNVSDNSGSFSLVQASHQPGASFTTGSTAVTYTYTDGSQNSASCSFLVNIIAVDRLPPQVTCPPDEVYNVEVPLSGRTVNFGTATATDLSTVSLVSVTPQTGTFFSTGSTTVTYTYRDASNNEASCTFLVIVNPVDNTPPIIQNCPSQLSEEIGFGATSGVVSWPIVFASDNSGQVEVLRRSHNNGDIFPLGTAAVTIEFSDPSGNTALCSFSVTVTAQVDNIPPVVNCPPDVTQTVELGTSSRQVFFDTPTVSDNSGSFSLVQASHQSGNSFTTGATIVTYTYTDGSGNTASCSFRITINAVDNIPPVVNCPADVTQTVELGTSSRQVFFDVPNVSDNSGSFSLVQASHQPGASFTTGSTAVTYTYTDGSQNSASCSFLVNIIAVDRVPPQVTCPPDEVYNVEVPLSGRTVNFGTATATDLSTVSLVSVTPQTGTFFSTGSTTVTYTYRDASNNEASCTFLVIVNPDM
ncbi:hyalin-like [Lytechinus pictus]|uniref:hyalin-like n=1 Tax=Lytechinus pictus TaxID=7653 RepID=UPI0030B9BDA7